MSGRGMQLDVQVVRGDFRLEVAAAWPERVAVLFGPSGAGKSTLLETIVGLHPLTRGRVEIAGEVLADTARGLHVPIEARGLGWVPQDPSLLPHLSVAGNLALGMRRAGAEGSRHLKRALEVLEIGDLLQRSVTGLSGGERQRVALARALASGPRALLLDEPLASLDVGLRARVLPHLLRVRDELELPILAITHDPDEALLLAETLIVLDNGRLVAHGEPRDVLWSRAVLPLSETLGLENVLDARALPAHDDSGRVETAAGLRLAVPARLEAGERVRLGVRAEDLLLAAGEPGRLSARNVFAARVTRLEQRDADVLVHLDAGDALVAKITRAASSALALSVGSRIHVVLKAQAIRRLA